jgi:endonuclease/exonuclease/phosphatase family metal-dependent hydrolase
MRAAACTLVLLFVAASVSGAGRVLILSYNVQNLFDGRVDGSEYAEYRPPHWTPDAAEAKLAALGRAIRRAARPAGALSPGRTADLIALQEVENLEVLLRLRDRYLADLGYRYAVLVAQEGAATHTAFLSRLAVIRTAVHPCGDFSGLPLRHVLEIEVEHQGRRLIVINNHWKSKTGGIAKTAAARRQSAAVVRRRIEVLLRDDPAADVIVVGDLNENVDEAAESGGRYATALRPWEQTASERRDPESEAPGRILLCRRPEQAGPGARGLALYEPWYELPEEDRGSSVYRGRWQTPDHLLLAPGLFDELGFAYRPGSFRAVRLRHLLDPESGHPLPFRPAPGGRGGKGTSDHLPLIIELRMPGPPRGARGGTGGHP